MYIYIYIYTGLNRGFSCVTSQVHGGGDTGWGHLGFTLPFTRYCYYQYCMMYSIHTGGRKGSRILSNKGAILLHQGGQSRWAGGRKG